MLTLHQVSYIHSNRDLLFENIHLSLSAHHKAALVGNNGVGKSSLLRMVAGELQPSGGTIATDTSPYYTPQHFGQFNELTIARALRVDKKLAALKAIADGRATEADLILLDDDWLLEERCTAALAAWELTGVDLDRRMGSLSGGQKTKVFLAGIDIHQPTLVLLDEPSNHLDASARDKLYSYIRTTPHTLLVVSHDRMLLNLMDTTLELNKKGIHVYGGNYGFYAMQKDIEASALDHDLQAKEKALRQARAVEREALERKQKLDARGKKKQEKAGLPTISMKTFKNNAEKSTARLKDTHTAKADALTRELSDLRQSLPGTDKMKIDLSPAAIHTGKKIIEAQDVNYAYASGHTLWREPLNFIVNSGDRLAINGSNGAGKTTLIHLMLGRLLPTTGTMYRAPSSAIYIDQDYSLIDNSLTPYTQAQQFNDRKLPEHDVRIRLTRFLFTRQQWDKPCAALSGGEKLRLMLCCLTLSLQNPDVIILDEPTNNLDIQNADILTAAMREYKGTLIVISHDQYFLNEIKVETHITLTP